MSSDLDRRYVVHGRVQGVGYRYFVERAAGKLGCSGYVRNRADGAVEVYARGPASKLKQLAEKLAQGPPLALIDQVEELEAAPEAVDGFQVRY